MTIGFESGLRVGEPALACASVPLGVHSGATGSGGDEEYVVERILAKRTTRRGEEQYLVAWQGYAPEHNTWEPHGAVKDCEALDEFERLQASRD